jgi:cytochrome c556
MVAKARLLSLVAALLVVACALQPVEAQEPVVLARSMLEVLAPRTNEIVGVLIDNLGADGEVDPASLSNEEWAAMAAAVASLQEETVALRSRPIQVVAAPGDKIFGEETSGLSAADVQAMIEADRADFDFYTDVFLADVVRMRDAIAARDAPTLWQVADEIDHKCEACHEQFWYPNWEETAQPPT